MLIDFSLEITVYSFQRFLFIVEVTIWRYVSYNYNTRFLFIVEVIIWQYVSYNYVSPQRTVAQDEHKVEKTIF